MAFDTEFELCKCSNKYGLHKHLGRESAVLEAINRTNESK